MREILHPVLNRNGIAHKTLDFAYLHRKKLNSVLVPNLQAQNVILFAFSQLIRCARSGAVFLKPNVADFMSFNFNYHKVGYHGIIKVNIYGYVLTGIMFQDICTNDFTGSHTTPNHCSICMKSSLILILFTRFEHKQCSDIEI